MIDMSKSETFAETVEKATSLFGRVDMLINNAGMCVGVLLVWVYLCTCVGCTCVGCTCVGCTCVGCTCVGVLAYLCGCTCVPV